MRASLTVPVLLVLWFGVGSREMWAQEREEEQAMRTEVIKAGQRDSTAQEQEKISPSIGISFGMHTADLSEISETSFSSGFSGQVFADIPLGASFFATGLIHYWHGEKQYSPKGRADLHVNKIFKDIGLGIALTLKTLITPRTLFHFDLGIGGDKLTVNTELSNDGAFKEEGTLVAFSVGASLEYGITTDLSLIGDVRYITAGELSPSGGLGYSLIQITAGIVLA